MPDRSTFGDLSMSRWHGRTVTTGTWPMPERSRDPCNALRRQRSWSTSSTGARPLRPGDMLPPPNPEETALPCPDHSPNQPRR